MKPIDQVLTCLSECFEYALLSEVSATPKPGLVDRHDSGAHTDMCFGTFAASTAAIVPYLTEMAKLGLTWEAGESSPSDHIPADSRLFRAIRPIGIEAERAMFAATGGVNTHKGMIFSMGLIAAAGGVCFHRHGKFLPETILELAGAMCRDDLQRDFAAMDPAHPKTHGEILYARYGSKGIRGEAMCGFPAIGQVSLPVLRGHMNRHGITGCIASDRHGRDRSACNQAYLNTLLSLMAQVDDTNVLIRTSPELLAFEQSEASRILSLGGADTDEGIAALEALNREFVRLNISPGGCADLLAVTILLWELEQYGG